MIPVNSKKALEIKKLIRDIESAKVDTPVNEWLLPHMSHCKFKAGQYLWRKGDKAKEIFYVESGDLLLLENQEIIKQGSLIGEIGLLSLEGRRTLTILCKTDCSLYRMSDEKMIQLYYQNHKLGFYVIRMIVGRLMKDIKEGNQTGSVALSYASK